MSRLGSSMSLVMAAAIAAACAVTFAAKDVNGSAATPSGSLFGNIARPETSYPEADAPGEVPAPPSRRAEKGVLPALPQPASTRRADEAEDCARKNALGTSRILEVSTTGGLEVGFKTYPQSLQLEDKEVVLTFDDGPLPSSTKRVLDALRAECVRATFFLIGRNAQAHPDLVRREIGDGHTVGHHSWSHPEKTLRGISEAAARAEIVDGISAVQRASGQEPYKNGTPHVPFFRFPGFADTAALKSMLQDRDIGIFGADIWASDWDAMSAATQLHLVMQRLEQERRGIILFHDTRSQTAAMLPAFLAELKSKNYRVVHIVPGSGERSPVRLAPPSWTSETEAILARIMPRLLRTKAGSNKVKPEM